MPFASKPFSFNNETRLMPRSRWDASTASWYIDYKGNFDWREKFLNVVKSTNLSLLRLRTWSHRFRGTALTRIEACRGSTLLIRNKTIRCFEVLRCSRQSGKFCSPRCPWQVAMFSTSRLLHGFSVCTRFTGKEYEHSATTVCFCIEPCTRSLRLGREARSCSGRSSVRRRL